MSSICACARPAPLAIPASVPTALISLDNVRAAVPVPARMNCRRFIVLLCMNADSITEYYQLDFNLGLPPETCLPVIPSPLELYRCGSRDWQPEQATERKR